MFGLLETIIKAVTDIICGQWSYGLNCRVVVTDGPRFDLNTPFFEFYDNVTDV